MNISVPSMQDLLSAGVHFGHKVSRGHPRMKPYIFGARDGVHIIDLSLSEEKLKEAAEAAYKYGKMGKLMLIVGTKKQAREIAETLAKEGNLPYLNSRWIGGLFTNFPEVRKNVEKLLSLKSEQEKGTLSRYTKKEQLLISRKLKKFDVDMGGASDLKALPDLMFIIDTVADKTAVKEANMTGVPIIGLSDTNANPDLLDHPIPANDDGIKSIKLISETIVNAYLQGKKEAGAAAEKLAADEAKKAVKAQETEVTDTQVEEAAAAIEEEIEKEIIDESSRKVE